MSAAGRSHKGVSWGGNFFRTPLVGSLLLLLESKGCFSPLNMAVTDGVLAVPLDTDTDALGVVDALLLTCLGGSSK